MCNHSKKWQCSVKQYPLNKAEKLIFQELKPMGDSRPALGVKESTKKTKEDLTLLGEPGVRRAVSLWHEERKLLVIQIGLN